MLGNGYSVAPMTSVFEPTGHTPTRTANKGCKPLPPSVECAYIMHTANASVDHPSWTMFSPFLPCSASGARFQPSLFIARRIQAGYNLEQVGLTRCGDRAVDQEALIAIRGRTRGKRLGKWPPSSCGWVGPMRFGCGNKPDRDQELGSQDCYCCSYCQHCSFQP